MYRRSCALCQRSISSFPEPIVIVSLYVFLGRNCALSPLNSSIFAMLALVFSWTMFSILAPKNSLLPVWSLCVCVLMMRVMGLLVTLLTRSTIVGPKPGSLASTIVTPPSVMNTATLPPLNADVSSAPEPVMTYRLSLTFSIFVAATAFAEGPGA